MSEVNWRAEEGRIFCGGIPVSACTVVAKVDEFQQQFSELAQRYVDDTRGLREQIIALESRLAVSDGLLREACESALKPFAVVGSRMPANEYHENVWQCGFTVGQYRSAGDWYERAKKEVGNAKV